MALAAGPGRALTFELTAAAVAVAVVATAAGAVIQGAIGFGMNLVTVPALALVLPRSLPVTVIALGVPMSLGMLRHEHRFLDRAGLAWIFAGRLPGTVAGAWVVAELSTVSLQAVVGVAVLALVVATWVSPPLPVVPGSQLAAGVVSGVTGTTAGIGGPPLALLYQHHPGPTMRSTLAASFLFGTLLSLATLAAVGEVGRDQLVLGVALAPVVLLGAAVGRRLHPLLDRGWLRPAVLAFAALAALAVIADAVT